MNTLNRDKMGRITQIILLVICVFIRVVPTINAITVEELVGDENARELRSSGTVKRIHVKDTVLNLDPTGTMVEKYVGEIASFDPSLVVEALYLYQKPVGAARGGWTGSERTAVYNAMRSLSTLAGIEYYSASRQSMRIFYETSVIVDGPESTVVLPDPIVDTPPQQDSLYAIQKDLTFGENRYLYVFYAENQGLAFMQENLTSMRYGVFPILGKNKLRTTVLVLDAEDALVMYAVSAARAFRLPGIETKVRNSFSNRADAIYDWFAKRTDEAFKSAQGK